MMTTTDTRKPGEYGYVEWVGSGRFRCVLRSHAPTDTPANGRAGWRGPDDFRDEEMRVEIRVSRPLDTSGPTDRQMPDAPITAFPFLFNHGDPELSRAIGDLGVTLSGTVDEAVEALGRQILAALEAYYGPRGVDVLPAEAAHV